jgi:RimJ/RimL family protein N-acetyltransferase
MCPRVKPGNGIILSMERASSGARGKTARSDATFGRVKKAFYDHVYQKDQILNFARPLSKPSTLRKISSSSSVIVGSTEEDIILLVRDFPDRAKYFKEYIRQGHTTFFHVREGKVNAYIWASVTDFNDRYLWKHVFTVGPGEFFHFAGYIDPSSRGSTYGLLIMQTMFDHYKSLGYSASKTAVSVRNVPSWRMMLKLGYEQTDDAIDAYKLLNLRWSRKTHARTRVSLD